MRVDKLTPDQQMYARRQIRRGEGETVPVTVWEVEGEGDDEKDVRATYEYHIGKLGAAASMRVIAVIAVSAMKGADIQKAVGLDMKLNPLLLLRMLDDGLAHELLSAVLGESPAWVAEHWDFEGWVVPVVVRQAKYIDFLALKAELENSVLPELMKSR